MKQEAWQRLKKNKLSLVILILLIVSFFALVWYATRPWNPPPVVLETPREISSRTIDDICYDEPYRYVAAGTRNGIFLFDLQSDDLRTHFFNSTLFPGSAATRVAHLQGSSRIFVLAGRENRTMGSYDITSNSWQKLDVQIPAGANVSDIDIDKDGQMLFATTDVGLIVHNISSETSFLLSIAEGLSSNNTSVLLSLRDWLLVGHSKGITVFDRSTWKPLNHTFSFGNEDLACTCLAASDNLNRIYVGTKMGLRMLTYYDDQLKEIEVPRYSGLPNVELQALELDKLQHVLYVGTKDGLCWFDARSEDWGGLLTNRFGPEHRDVRAVSIFRNENGTKLFVGTTSGLVWIDPSSLNPGQLNYEVWGWKMLQDEPSVSSLLSATAIGLSITSYVILARRLKQSTKSRREKVLALACAYLKALATMIDNNSFPLDAENLSTLLDPNLDELDVNWIHEIAPLTEDVKRLNEVLPNFSDSSAAIQDSTFKNQLTRIRNQIKSIRDAMECIN